MYALKIFYQAVKILEGFSAVVIMLLPIGMQSFCRLIQMSAVGIFALIRVFVFLGILFLSAWGEDEKYVQIFAKAKCMYYGQP